MYTRNHQSHQVTAEGQTGLSSSPYPLLPAALVSSTKAPYAAIAENPRNILTNSIEQLFYSGSVSAPFDLRLLQYACFQCKTRLLKHISNFNSRYTDPNLVHELCTPCKYVFLSISQKSNQKLKLPQQNSDSCLISLDSNPLQSTLLNDVFFSVPSPEKFETDDLELKKYDSTSRWTDTSSPTLSPTDFLIDEGENLFGFDLDPDFSSDQSTFGSSDTESSETASVHSPLSASTLKPKCGFESVSPPSSPTMAISEYIDTSEIFQNTPSSSPSILQDKKRPMETCTNGTQSESDSFQSPTKLAKLAHTYSELSTEDVAESPRGKDTDEDQEEITIEEDVLVEEATPRTTSSPTIFETLSGAHVDWCRYCGTTEGVNWRPGPWGKRTLCNKHGCDYKGYGFACKLPRLNLTAYVDESIDERTRPVLQLFCTVCQKQESHVGNVLVMCEGCPKAFHQKCCPGGISDEIVHGHDPWFCDDACNDNLKKRRIVVELPRKRLPLMCNPKSTPECGKPKPTSRTESPRKPQTRKATKPPASHESKPYSKKASKIQSATKGIASPNDQDSYSDVSPSRRVVPRSGGKNLSHYALINRTMNYYESSSDSE